MTRAANTSPTILQVVPELDTGGAELTAVEISEAVIQAGGRALVASAGGRLEQRLIASGAQLVGMNAATKNPLAMLMNARKLKRLIADENIDLVHARSRAPAWSARWATTHTPAHFVTTYHGAYGQKNALKGYYNAVMAKGDRVIANSNFTAQLVSERHGTRSDRLRTIYRGIDTALYDPDAIAPAAIHDLRGSWGVPAPGRIILHPARLSPIKGQQDVLNALSHGHHALKEADAHVVFTGDAQGRSEYEGALRDQAAALECAARIHFVGHCADMPTAFAAAEMVLMPSRVPETFGRVAAEAQAMRRPVIVTRIGALPEVVLSPPDVSEAERTGWSVPVSDRLALAQTIKEVLLLSPNDKRAITERARARVSSEFSLDAMKRRTLTVYDEILGSNLAARL